MGLNSFGKVLQDIQSKKLYKSEYNFMTLSYKIILYIGKINIINDVVVRFIVFYLRSVSYFIKVADLSYNSCKCIIC